MTWVRIDDQFFFKPRARQAGKDGRALFWAGLCFCAANLTDGVIVTPSLPFVAAMAEVELNVADLLVKVGLWAAHDHHYEVVDYLTYQQSRQQVIAEREAAAERKRRQRSRHESRRDSQNGHGGSSAHPVPVPDELSRPSSSGNSRRAATAVENPEDDGQAATVPPATWQRFAEIKLDSELRRKPGSINNETGWKRTTRENAEIEHRAQAARWWAEYDITPHRLAECLIDGKAPGPQYRRKEPG